MKDTESKFGDFHYVCIHRTAYVDLHNGIGDEIGNVVANSDPGAPQEEPGSASGRQSSVEE